MTIIDESRASVALDHDAECGTQSERENDAYEWLTTHGYKATTAYTFSKSKGRACVARIWQEVNAQRAYGKTLVQATEAAARKAGWRG